ncbi:putative bifunctional diguanylate cyclase/phosphodiesterase [Shewanella mangrovi]|uniref:putative bifunctional diguanylate cyclase/phosphodiesterase n=1 Tax=Shewanella mangrovi TaxID=1515746 RepID=UPI0006901580|nr:GGDEF domain-containing phosphodiesterase [Shewanella mangrovi]
MKLAWRNRPFISILGFILLYSAFFAGIYFLVKEDAVATSIQQAKVQWNRLLQHSAESLGKAIIVQDDKRIEDELSYISTSSDSVSVAFIDNRGVVRFANHAIWLNIPAVEAFEHYSVTTSTNVSRSQRPFSILDKDTLLAQFYYPVNRPQNDDYSAVNLIYVAADVHPAALAAIAEFNRQFTLLFCVVTSLLALAALFVRRFLFKPVQQLTTLASSPYRPAIAQWPMTIFENLADAITASHQHNQRLLERIRDNEQRWLFAVDGNRNGLWDWDIVKGKVFFSSRWKEILGFSPTELDADFSTWRQQLHPEDQSAALEVLQDYLDGKADEYDSLHRLQHKDGHYVWVKSRGMIVAWDVNGRPLRMLGYHADVSDDIQNQHALAFLASHDPLTNLANREHLNQTLSRICALPGRFSYCAVFVIDLDNFKIVNDALGHKSGDSLLLQISKRLSDTVGEHLLARLGADEFALVVEDAGKTEEQAREQAFAMAGAIRQSISQSLVINGHKLHVSASIGIDLLRPGQRSSSGELLRCADMAMFDAKERGRDNCVIYSAEMEHQVNTQLIIQNDLRDAIERRQLELYYQPIVDEHGILSGAEALLRWRHPQFGFISPADFIPVAERCGLIDNLTRWVVKEVCEFVVQNAEKQLPKISINISARQFNDPKFVEGLLVQIKGRQLTPRAFELELTEHLFLTDLSLIKARFNELQQAGFSIAIDDFGTGYSSLSYLQHLPLSRLKIDAAFVRNIGKTEQGNTLVKAIIEMAHAMKLDVVAEGVETPDQHTYLKSQQCDWFQGYLWSRPLPAAEFARLLPRAGDVRQLLSTAEPIQNQF